MVLKRSVGFNSICCHNIVYRSFGKVLKDNYFKELESRLHTVYLSEGYSAVAIITQEAGVGIPYLDKFSISLQRQVR